MSSVSFEHRDYTVKAPWKFSKRVIEL
jgi:hypothetical protein